jgi:hypothetical protein
LVVVSRRSISVRSKGGTAGSLLVASDVSPADP